MANDNERSELIVEFINLIEDSNVVEIVAEKCGASVNQTRKNLQISAIKLDTESLRRILKECKENGVGNLCNEAFAGLDLFKKKILSLQDKKLQDKKDKQKNEAKKIIQEFCTTILNDYPYVAFEIQCCSAIFPRKLTIKMEEIDEEEWNKVKEKQL